MNAEKQAQPAPWQRIAEVLSRHAGADIALEGLAEADSQVSATSYSCVLQSAEGAAARVQLAGPVAQRLAADLLARADFHHEIRPLMPAEVASLDALLGVALSESGLALWVEPDRPTTRPARVWIYRLTIDGITGWLRLAFDRDWLDHHHLGPTSLVAALASTGAGPTIQLEIELARVALSGTDIDALAAGDLMFPAAWRSGPPAMGVLVARGRRVGTVDLDWDEDITWSLPARSVIVQPLAQAGGARVVLPAGRFAVDELAGTARHRDVSIGRDAVLRVDLPDGRCAQAELIEVEARFGLRLTHIEPTDV